ncbi:hypothetical protein TrST_g6755 [Triparma strigata]|uniref:Tyrosyl-DNA phosphodiesterase n=1 Tax=Triparma strigata TaxID=1606541 RepID=A0A9W7F1I9_9STRA|nr:hypothetical protein TrST_g6755 [Triparma strigata]
MPISCPSCTFLNEVSVLICELCETPLAAVKSPTKKTPPSHPSEVIDLCDDDSSADESEDKFTPSSVNHTASTSTSATTNTSTNKNFLQQLVDYRSSSAKRQKLTLQDHTPAKSKSISNSNSNHPPAPLLFHMTYCNQHRDSSLNKFSLSLTDVFSGPFTHALISNFLISPQHLMSAAPRLKSVPSLCIYGSMYDQENHALRESRGNMKLYQALVSRYGSMHSKFAFLFYETGVRIAIFTNNWINEPFLTNGVYVQDFPRKGDKSAKTTTFEEELVRYLRKVGGPLGGSAGKMESFFPNQNLPSNIEESIRKLPPSKTISLPASLTKAQRHAAHKLCEKLKFVHETSREGPQKNCLVVTNPTKNLNPSPMSHDSTPTVPAASVSYIEMIRNFDFSRANAILIASVPGKYKTEEHRWGQSALRHHLQDVPHLENSKVLCQFSSFGGTTQKHVEELTEAFSTTSDPTSTSPSIVEANSLIVWPSLENVLVSYAGLRSGHAIPAQLKNVLTEGGEKNSFILKESIAKHLHLWRSGGDSDRTLAAPHIKSFTRFSEDGQLSYFLLASHNFSKSAWGQIQLKGKQLSMESYELGVLFKPSLFFESDDETGEDENECFSCTPTHPKLGLFGFVNTKKFRYPKAAVKLVSGASVSGACPEGTLLCPVPYALPPQKYGQGDVPWCSDFSHANKRSFTMPQVTHPCP